MHTKIAIIIDNISCAGGTERAVTSLCNGLLRFYPEDYQITIISIFSKNGESSFFELNPKIKILHLAKEPGFKLWNKFFWYRRLVIDIHNLSKEKGFDILLGTTYVHNILLPLMVRNIPTKSIGCEHVVYNYPPKMFQALRKWFYPKLNAVVVLNQQEQKNFYFLKNTIVIPNSLPFNNTQKAKLDAKNIITVGRLTHEKGVDILIDIYQKIAPEIPDWTLSIYGVGEDLASLQEQISAQNLEEYIKLKGLSKNISESYLQSSIFVLGSRSESFGIVIIEAMNHGLPVISFDADGPKNIITDNENGFLIQQFDQELFSKKLLSLIKDKEKRNVMGHKAYASSLAYQEEKIIPIWNQQLQALLKTR